MPEVFSFRLAGKKDIVQIQFVRNAVLENRLSDPGLVTDNDVENYLTIRGRGWVCEAEGIIVGFSIADMRDHNIWALFVHPDFEKKGIGVKLHNLMLDWYFSQTDKKVWLGTSPGTRAERFYRKAGWIETGTHGKGEIKFEMTLEEWNRISKNKL
jgi:GNAT superfamily N-acetyltransferase